MWRKSFSESQCPIARSLEVIGDWWTILIIHDGVLGLRRFDEFQKSLKILPSTLTRRLGTLLEAGLLERHQYDEHPPRYEYLLTARGRDFRSVISARDAWGREHA